MRKVILIPVETEEELSMYELVTKGGVTLDSLDQLLFVKIYDLLLDLYQSRNVPLWGVPSGKKSTLANTWNNIAQNDVVVFSRNGEFLSVAQSKVKFQSDNVAQHIWSNPNSLDPRRYIFSIDNFLLLSKSKKISLKRISLLSKLNLSEFQIQTGLVAQEFLSELKGLIDPANETESGFGLSALEKKAIENYSVKVACLYLSKIGFTEITDVGATESFDLIAKSQEKVIHVEVKGSTGSATQITLTKNEVLFQKIAYPENALLIVSNIVLDRVNSLATSGGEVNFISPWQIEDSSLTPISFNYLVQS